MAGEHNNEFNTKDHEIRIKKYADILLESELEEILEDGDGDFEWLIEISEVISLMLACYRKHKTNKADPSRFKQHCPLCHECIHCECVKTEVEAEEKQESEVPF